MMVVFSLPTSMRLAWPRSASVTFSKRQADFFGDHFAAGQDGDVFQHGFATVTEARRLDSNDFQDAADGC
jgi:hypothetical protein